MKKREIVKKASDFDEIIQKGKKVRNKYFLIFSKEVKTDIPLFGLAVSKKIGNAVTRNKIKRQLRNIIDNIKLDFKNNHKYIIMINSDGSKLSFEEKEKSLKGLIKGEK